MGFTLVKFKREQQITMSVIIILLIVSICIAGGFLVAFLWSVKDGQFDDIESPANRILFNNNKTNKK